MTIHYYFWKNDWIKIFSRVHRKYIVNKTYIKKITPHLNGRYIIAFTINLEAITSSKSYIDTIRKLIKNRVILHIKEKAI